MSTLTFADKITQNLKEYELLTLDDKLKEIMQSIKEESLIIKEIEIAFDASELRTAHLLKTRKEILKELSEK